MSFEADKRRLQFIRNREIENQFKAERQKIQDSLINRDVKKLSPNHSTFKRHKNLTVDWQSMIHAVFNGSSDPDTQYIDWEVVLERFDERFIPFINIEVLTRVSDGSINDGANIETPNKIVVFELEDLPNETYTKKLTIRASYYFSDGDVFLPYEAKLLITFSHYQDNV